jgi:hypothetical protein
MEIQMNIADRFAQIEAEYNAIKALYEAAKDEALQACMDACPVDATESTVDGDRYTLHFKLTGTTTFSSEKAKAFLTDEQIASCMVTGTRRNLKAKTKANIKLIPA